MKIIMTNSSNQVFVLNEVSKREAKNKAILEAMKNAISNVSSVVVLENEEFDLSNYESGVSNLILCANEFLATRHSLTDETMCIEQWIQENGNRKEYRGTVLDRNTSQVLENF